MNKQKKQVLSLVLMLSSAVIVAFLVVAWIVYYYGSSGTYLLRNVLISPKSLESISFAGPDVKGQSFIFNKIEFVQAEAHGQGWARYSVSKESYTEFYHSVANERSLPLISDELIRQFETLPLSTLTIFVQALDNQGKAHQEVSLFQEVDFLNDGDYFRVLLRDEAETWVYFRAEGIYNKITQLFASRQNVS